MWDLSRKYLGWRIAIINSILILCVYLQPIFATYFLPQSDLNRIGFGLAVSWSLKVLTHVELFVNNFLECYLNAPSIGRLDHFNKHVVVEDGKDKL